MEEGSASDSAAATARARLVLSALGEEAYDCQSQMWAMVLAYMHAVPTAWAGVDQSYFTKAVLPKLCNSLRYGDLTNPIGSLIGSECKP